MLTNNTLKEFVDVLASSAPAPGGGSAAALSGSMGAALVAMVCRLTIGKAGYEEHEPIMKEVLTEAEGLRESLLNSVQTDTEAFEKVMAAFAMPKGTDDEKRERSSAIQKAFKGAVASPEGVANLCLRVLEIGHMIVAKCNTNAISDIGVGVEQAFAGLKGAILNVKINLPSIKDTEYVETKKKWISDIMTNSQDLISKTEKIVNEKL